MYAGLLSPGTKLSFTCPSGNCTWVDFASLGICSSCMNVTDIAKPTVSGNDLNVTTPNGITVSLSKEVNRKASTVAEGIELVLASGTTSEETFSTTQSITNVTIAQKKDIEDDEQDLSWIEKFRLVWNIFECQIEYCVKVHKEVTVVSKFTSFFGDTEHLSD